MTHAEHIVGKTLDTHLERIQELLEETDNLIDALGSRKAAIHNPKVQRNLRLLSALQQIPYDETCADFGLLKPESKKTNKKGSGTSQKKDEGVKPRAHKISDSEIIEAVKLGKRPVALASQFGCSNETMASRLKRIGLDRKARRELQLAANPRVTELLDILTTIGTNKKLAETKLARGFYTPELFVLVAELKQIYDIGTEDIARDILRCSSQSFNTELSRYKNEGSES